MQRLRKNTFSSTKRMLHEKQLCKPNRHEQHAKIYVEHR